MQLFAFARIITNKLEMWLEFDFFEQDSRTKAFLAGSIFWPKL